MARIERGSIAVDIAAREAQVIGDGPRIEPLGPDEVDGDALDLIVTIRNSVGVTSMVQVQAQHGARRDQTIPELQACRYRHCYGSV